VTRPLLRSLAVAVAVAPALAGCGTDLLPGLSGSGTVVESSVEVDEITALTVGSTFDVTLQIGDAPAVVLRADDNVLDRISVTQQDGELGLGVDAAVGDVTLQAQVTVDPATLTRVELDGAATLTGTETLEAPALTLSTLGASRAFVVLDVAELDVTAAGASVVNASGTVDALTAVADGASTLRLDQLAARTADVRAAGSSTVEVLVSERLDAQADGASTIGYAGDPAVLERSTSGASSVVPR
jgi:hypothetical protein